MGVSGSFVSLWLEWQLFGFFRLLVIDLKAPFVLFFLKLGELRCMEVLILRQKKCQGRWNVSG